MRRRNNALFASLIVLATLPTAAQATMKPQEVVRKEQGNRITENVPEIPAELIERLNRYQNTRGASFAGWTK